MSAELPEWPLNVFDELNNTFFDSKLPSIKFSINKHGGQYAAFAPVGDSGILWFHPGTLLQGRAFVADSMLHELIHYALHRRDGDGDQAHGYRFVEYANGIGARLSLPPVKLGSDEVLEWPQSVRPDGFHSWVTTPLAELPMPEVARLLILTVAPFLAAEYRPELEDPVALVTCKVKVTEELLTRVARLGASGSGRGPVSWGWVPRTRALEGLPNLGYEGTANMLAAEVPDGEVPCVAVILDDSAVTTMSIEWLLTMAAEGLPKARPRRAPDAKERNRAKAARRARRGRA
ncbi:SprT-like domain-containing protein [Sorangium sp. So ce1389]|uniref:SprT-like domain-containing protein n=1 Tax=Sorangium sp. So ce1389 TaxID=3133336 RepID=UPI003F5DEF4E